MTIVHPDARSVHARDAFGASWKVGQVVDPLGAAGRVLAGGTSNGVVYFRPSTRELMFARQRKHL